MRGRAGISWSKRALGLSVFANHSGKLRDARQASVARLGATTSFDASLRLTFADWQGPLKGVDLILAAQNMFNMQPPLIRTTNVWEAPYDSTNYSAVGRFVSLSLSKSF